MSEEQLHEEGTIVQDFRHLQLPTRCIRNPETAPLSCMVSKLRQHPCKNEDILGQI